MAAVDRTENSSNTSYYVNNGYYERLIADFTGWQRRELEISDPGVRDGCRGFLEREARYLQDLRFDDWLGLYAAECLYWVPGGPEAGDPRREVAIAFDDRRRLEDRTFRLQMSYAWSQRPPSRTVRMVGNVEVFQTSLPEVLMVRSNLLINEFWAEESRVWGGWCGHRLRWQEAEWRILVKQVNLVDCERNLRNPSIIL